MRLVVGGEEHRIVVGETEVDVRTGSEATKLDVVDRTQQCKSPLWRVGRALAGFSSVNFG